MKPREIDLDQIPRGKAIDLEKNVQVIFSFDEVFLRINQNFSNISPEQQQPLEQKGRLFENIFSKENESQLSFIKNFLECTKDKKIEIKSKFAELDKKTSDFIFVKDSNSRLVGVANKNFNCKNKDDPNNFLIIVKQKKFKTEIAEDYLKLNDLELTKFLSCLGVVRENVDATSKAPENEITVSSATHAETGTAVKQNRNGDILSAVAQAVILYNGNNRFGLRQTGVLAIEGKDLEIKFANDETVGDETKARAMNNFKFLFQKVCQEKSITLEDSNEVLTFDKLKSEEKLHVSQNLQQRIETTSPNMVGR